MNWNLQLNYMRVAILLSSLFVSTVAWSDWKRLDDEYENTFTVWYAPATIQRKGDLVEVWQLMSFKKAMMINGREYRSSKRHLEFDCRKELFRRRHISWWQDEMAKGLIVMHLEFSTDWGPIRSESVGSLVLKAACSAH